MRKLEYTESWLLYIIAIDPSINGSIRSTRFNAWNWNCDQNEGCEMSVAARNWTNHDRWLRISSVVGGGGKIRAGGRRGKGGKATSASAFFFSADRIRQKEREKKERIEGKQRERERERRRRRRRIGGGEEREGKEEEDPPCWYSHFGVRRSLLAKYLNLSFSFLMSYLLLLHLLRHLSLSLCLPPPPPFHLI